MQSLEGQPDFQEGESFLAHSKSERSLVHHKVSVSPEDTAWFHWSADRRRQGNHYKFVDLSEVAKFTVLAKGFPAALLGLLG